MDFWKIAENGASISNDEIASLLEKAIADWELRHGMVHKALILPPDFTRFHSNAGLITQFLYRLLTAKGAEVDIMPALGTHVAVSEPQWKTMFGDVPYSKMIVHDWRNDVVKLGEITSDEVSGISGGLWTDPVEIEVNRRLPEGGYDLIVSAGQVVPHEVVGMANHAKNLFVGVGGSDMINKSHMIGAVCGMEQAMGRDHAPVRRLFDLAFERCVSGRIPVLWVLTVNTAPGGVIHSHGLFIGEGRDCFTNAVKLAQKTNVDKVDRPFRKCVVYLDPSEFTSTWLGNKAIYRTRMAMADGGELIVLAPGVKRFGEDDKVDGLIRKYGYRGRLRTLEAFKAAEGADLRADMGAAAHLIHGSTDGRFSVTYCVKSISKSEVEGVGYKAADYDEVVRKYDPHGLEYGFNTIDGEEVFFIPNPALGLWIAGEL